MSRASLAALGPMAAAIVAVSLAPVAVAGQGPATPRTAPAQGSAAKRWTQPRTAWGDPDLQGYFTDRSELGTPFERPAEFEGRRIEDISEAELAKIMKDRQDKVVEDARPAGNDEPHAPLHWSDRFDITKGGRPWLVVDPPDGKVPPMTAEGQKRQAELARLGRRRDTWTDRTLWERCISRGLVGSMLPNILGNSFQILQTPGFVAIRYETIHETRLIPMDGRPPIGSSIRQYLGNSHGHWEGDTLVVESTNFISDETGIGQNGHGRYHSDALRLVERYHRVAPDKVM